MSPAILSAPLSPKAVILTTTALAPNGVKPSLDNNNNNNVNGTTTLSNQSANVNGAVTNGVGSDDAKHIWLVSGPAGCGKSTVAQYLADTLHYPYVEGDDFHTKANVEKMHSGTPLTDEDRWDWLIKLREEALHRLRVGDNGVVVTCSALKRKYRDVMRVARYFSPNVQVHFIYLHAPEEVLLARVGARQNHYMGANMVRSQVAVLEPPMPDETDMVSVDVSVKPEVVLADALDKVLKAMQH